jgi:hypothetical protein
MSSAPATDSGSAAKPQTSDLVKNAFVHDLGKAGLADKITVTVTPLFNDTYAVAFSGTLGSQGDVTKASAAAAAKTLLLPRALGLLLVKSA